MRENCAEIELGLDEFEDPGWQSVRGMLKTPFVGIQRRPASNADSLRGSEPQPERTEVDRLAEPGSPSAHARAGRRERSTAIDH
jgi:hypothetical protein